MIPWHPSVSIVNNLKSIWAINKPCDLLSQPNKGGVCSQSIVQASYDFDAEAYRTDEGKLYLLNRLDSPTSGLVLLCSDAQITQQIRTLFKMHSVQKIYYAIVKGFFPHKKILWQDLLRKVQKDHFVRTMVQKQAGVIAKTQVELIKTFRWENETLSFIRLKPLTGRTHQLRVQCALHHLPIIGDKTYGNFAWNRSAKIHRLYLHAASIQFSLPNLFFNAECDFDFSPFI